MNQIAQIEAILFALGDEGIHIKDLGIALDENEENIEKLLNDYSSILNDDMRGIELHYYGEKVKLLTKEKFHSVIANLLDIKTERKLSQAALETLAIIAYKQPITRMEIEEIRGVNSDMMCRKLEAMDLIRETGRADSIGRPILYEVTDAFMDMFQLNSLEELPKLNIGVNENYDLFKE